MKPTGGHIEILPSRQRRENLGIADATRNALAHLPGFAEFG
jgi:hypothetical protein